MTGRRTAEHRDFLRMPATLGPASGPRNMPRSREHLRFDGAALQISILAETDAAALAQLLPERCSLFAEPVIEIQYSRLERLGWLAGRSYNVLALRVPVRFQAAEGEVDCTFMPVLWENMADPVLTGREELGSPKLYAEIQDPREVAGRWCGQASWDGHRFFEFETSALEPADGPTPKPPPTLLYRYLPRTGELEARDVAQMTIARGGSAPPATLLEHRIGEGRFTFHPATWEEMPTQYTFVNTLAALPLLRFSTARMTWSSGLMDLAAQKIID